MLHHEVFVIEVLRAKISVSGGSNMAEEFSDKQMSQMRSAIVIGVGEALEQIVLPRLADIEDTQSKHSQILAKHGDMLTKHGDMLTEQSERLERVERKLDATISVTDQLELRTKKLETKFA
jgi:t-SNARE complex subunit (syntaxin)